MSISLCSSSAARFLQRAALLCALSAGGGALAQEAVSLAAGRPLAASVTQMQQLPVGKTLRLQEVQLGENAPANSTLLLERFEVFAPGAKVVIQSDKGVEERSPAALTLFRGQVEGDPGSRVFWSVDAAGEMRGIVHQKGEIFVNQVPANAAASPAGETPLLSRRVDQAADFSDRQFQCDADRLTQPTDHLREVLDLAAKSSSPVPVERSVPAASTTLLNVNVAVDTDYEFYAKFGSSTTAERYVADLFAYISTIYQGELQTKLSVSNVYLYTTGASSDPWAATSTSGALTEVGNYWQSNRSAVSRSIVHFMSGKPMGGGIAWMPGLCSTQYGYGISGSIAGNFNPSNPQVIWDSIVVAHEIGHNFNSRHTHDFDGYSPAVGNGSPVDCCYADGNPEEGLCAGVTKDLPGISSLSGGTPGTGTGTIMSYCHLRSPGMSNLSWTFGLTHTYGVQASRVPQVMRTLAEQQNAANPACVSVDTGSSYTLSVSSSGASAVAISASPSTYAGTTDYSKTGIAAGTSITLTAPTGVGSATFASWSGCDSTSGASCTVTMNASKSVTVSYNSASTYTLTVNAAGATGVAVSASPTTYAGTTDYSKTGIAAGTSITLTAPTGVGSATFASWSGCDSTSGASCTVTMSASKTVTVTYNTPSYTLTVNSTGATGVAISASPTTYGGTTNYSKIGVTAGTSLTLTAPTGVGKATFVSWSGCDSTSGASCTLVMNSAKTATVTYRSSGSKKKTTAPVIMMLLE